MDCIGEINKKCYESANDRWEHRSDDLRLFLGYVDCFDEEATAQRCDYPIVNHYNAVLQAFKKHTEEKHGILGVMIKGIDH